MNPEHELNELFDRELRQLPTMSAPRSLAPRIMASVRAKAAAAALSADRPRRDAPSCRRPS